MGPWLDLNTESCLLGLLITVAHLEGKTRIDKGAIGL